MPDFPALLTWYYVFLMSLVAHEASHAWAAWRLGDDTAYEGGQVSLNPGPHIQREPWGALIIPIVTFMMNGWMFGWGSIPVDTRWTLNNPRASALVSLAGPTANLLLVIAAGILMRLGIALGWFFPPEWMNFTHVVAAGQDGILHALAFFLSVLFSLNIVMFIFNLLPLPPLDGSGLLPLFLKSEEASVRYLHFIHNPGLSIFGIVIAWKIGRWVIDPVHTFFVNSLYLGIVTY